MSAIAMTQRPAPAPTTARLSFKLYCLGDPEPSTDALVRTFHRWIQQRAVGHLLIDVHDYTHVPNGPGVMLVAHEAHYRIDRTDGRLGLRYARKRMLEGTWAERVKEVVRSTWRAAAALEEAPELGGGLRFDAGGGVLRIDDRLVAPNDASTRAWAEPLVRAAFEELYDGPVEVEADGPERTTFGLRVRASRPAALGALVARAGGSA